MDRSQLVTIAVTALITVTLREVITGIFSLAKIQVAKSITKEKVKKVFSKNSRKIIWDVLWTIAAIYALVSEIRKTSPVTHWEVFKIFLFGLSSGMWLLFLFIDIALIRIKKRLSPSSPQTT